MSKILLTGASGQLGTCVKEATKTSGALAMPDSQALDLSEIGSLRDQLETLGPQQIINCAAYTNVDKAESDTDKARLINTDAPAVLAEYAAIHKIPMVHISTDFVFDGKKSSPYRTIDATAPLNAYGKTKLAGEQKALLANPNIWIIRTSWTYSEYGSNFVLKILKLASKNDSLSVVTDQIGSPCYARNLAAAIWKLLEVRPKPGIYHFADIGEISRRDFALAAIEEASAAGILDKCIPVQGVDSDHFPSPARRPLYSVLDSSLIENEANVVLTDWRSGLQDMIRRLAAQQAAH
jgi:dTDP-4-dehydrorhamnose reductase